MNKNSIDENQAIQEGLEKFLDQQIGIGAEQLTQAAAPKVVSPKVVSPRPAASQVTSGPETRSAARPVYRREAFEEDTFEEDVFEEDYEEDDLVVPQARKHHSREHSSKNQPPKKPSTKKQSSKKHPAQKQSSKKHSSKKRPSKEQAPKKKSKFKKVLIILLIAIAAVLIWWYLMVGKIYQQMNYEKVQGMASEPMKQEGVINVLLIGNDSRSNGEDGRSDAMILLSVSNQTKTVHMTSLLRDMYVDIPGYEGNRLNAAYAYGGPSLLCETIEQNLGIEVNRYVLVNFQAFAGLVDAVGGIDLEVTNEEVQWINAYLNEYNLLEGRELTTDYLDTSLSGEIHLNGPQALAYSRNRYIGTDFGRTERQRKVLSAVMKKLPVAMATGQDELMEELFPNLTTNLTQAEVFSLSMDAGKLLSYDIIQTVIPAEGTYSNASIRGMSVLEVDFEANKAIIQKEIYGKEGEE